MTIFETISELLELDSISVREQRRLVELREDKMFSLTHADVKMIQTMETHHFAVHAREAPAIRRGPLFPNGDPRDHNG